MEKDKLESMLIDYIDGNLSAADARTIEIHLTESADARELHSQLKEILGALKSSPVLEPSFSMRRNFDEALRHEVAIGVRKGRQVFLTTSWFRAAAAVVLVAVSGAVAFWVVKTQQQQEELAALRKEMESTRSLMMAMLDDQQSASTRMKGATAAFNMESTDDKIVRALVKTMNEDPNTNVRLAALEALGKFNHQPHVRQALVASLATQKDPVVQIALIQLMVRMKEKGAVKDLEDITNDVRTMKAVKDEAYSGLMKLS